MKIGKGPLLYAVQSQIYDPLYNIPFLRVFPNLYLAMVYGLEITFLSSAFHLLF